MATLEERKIGAIVGALVADAAGKMLDLQVFEYLNL